MVKSEKKEWDKNLCRMMVFRNLLAYGKIKLVKVDLKRSCNAYKREIMLIKSQYLRSIWKGKLNRHTYSNILHINTCRGQGWL